LRYGAEVWQIPTREMNKILSTQMYGAKEISKKIKERKNKKRTYKRNNEHERSRTL
jgi:hypothetical protein